MAGGLTSVRQRTEVGEGLAVGCLVAGVAAVADRAGALDTAFAFAFATWSWSTRYPTVLRARQPVLPPVLVESASRRTVKVAQWITSRGLYVPQLRDDAWDLTAACAAVEEATAVPARRWCDLAEAFVDDLDDHLVWRHPPPEFDHDPQTLGLR